MNLIAITTGNGGFAFLIIFQILLVLLVIGLGIKLFLMLKPKKKAKVKDEDDEVEETDDESKKKKKKAKPAKKSKTSDEEGEEKDGAEEEETEKEPNWFVTTWAKFVGVFKKKEDDGEAKDGVVKDGAEEEEKEKKPNWFKTTWAKFLALFKKKEKSEAAPQQPVIVYVQAGAPEATAAPAPAPVPEDTPAPTVLGEVEDFDEDLDEELEEESFEGGTVTYNRSFMAKYIQAPDEVKNYYVHLKNRLMAYKRVRANTSWKRESFICGRKPLARLVFRGKTLCLFLPLDPTSFVESKYHVENVSSMTMYTDTPCMYRIKNDRRLEYAYELLDMVAADLGTEYTEVPEKDYYLPYEGIVQLIDKGLVKRVIRRNGQEFINPQE